MAADGDPLKRKSSNQDLLQERRKQQKTQADGSTTILPSTTGVDSFETSISAVSLWYPCLNWPGSHFINPKPVLLRDNLLETDPGRNYYEGQVKASKHGPIRPSWYRLQANPPPPGLVLLRIPSDISPKPSWVVLTQAPSGKQHPVIILGPVAEKHYLVKVVTTRSNYGIPSDMRHMCMPIEDVDAKISRPTIAEGDLPALKAYHFNGGKCLSTAHVEVCRWLIIPRSKILGYLYTISPASMRLLLDVQRIFITEFDVAIQECDPQIIPRHKWVEVYKTHLRGPVTAHARAHQEATDTGHLQQNGQAPNSILGHFNGQQYRPHVGYANYKASNSEDLEQTLFRRDQTIRQLKQQLELAVGRCEGFEKRLASDTERAAADKRDVEERHEEELRSRCAIEDDLQRKLETLGRNIEERTIQLNEANKEVDKESAARITQENLIEGLRRTIAKLEKEKSSPKQGQGVQKIGIEASAKERPTFASSSEVAKLKLESTTNEKKYGREALWSEKTQMLANSQKDAVRHQSHEPLQIPRNEVGVERELEYPQQAHDSAYGRIQNQEIQQWIWKSEKAMRETIQEIQTSQKSFLAGVAQSLFNEKGELCPVLEDLFLLTSAQAARLGLDIHALRKQTTHSSSGLVKSSNAANKENVPASATIPPADNVKQHMSNRSSATTKRKNCDANTGDHTGATSGVNALIVGAPTSDRRSTSHAIKPRSDTQTPASSRSMPKPLGDPDVFRSTGK